MCFKDKKFICHLCEHNLIFVVPSKSSLRINSNQFSGTHIYIYIYYESKYVKCSFIRHNHDGTLGRLLYAGISCFVVIPDKLRRKVKLQKEHRYYRFIHLHVKERKKTKRIKAIQQFHVRKAETQGKQNRVLVL